MTLGDRGGAIDGEEVLLRASSGNTTAGPASPGGILAIDNPKCFEFG